MKRKMRLAFSSSLRGPFGGAYLLASGLVLASATTPVQAQNFGFPDSYSRGYYPSSRYYSRDPFYSARPPSRLSDEGYETPRVDYLKAQTAEKLRKAPVPPPTKGPLMVVVSIVQQKLTVYDEGLPLLHSRVSTGSRGHETPTGVFAVIQKARWHRSNLYSDAPMPFMQRITWSGVALHAGVLPGYPASHGCIRLPEDFAIRMWRTTQMGARVIVVQNDVSPVEIAHPVLFAHKSSITIVPPPVAQAAPLIGLRSTVDAKADAAVTPAEAAGQAAAKTEVAQVKVADISAVSVLRGPQGSGHVSVANDQSSSETAVSEAEAGAQATAVSDTKAAADTNNTATVSPPAPTQAAAVTGASSSREGPVARNAPVQTAPQPSQPSILAQVPAVQAAPEPDGQSPLAATQPKLRPGPVSVFISRREQRIYVRKGFAPLFDMPIVIRDQDRAIGTHVFTALSLNPDGETMRWNVVSVGAAAARAERRAEVDVRMASRKRDHGKEIISDVDAAAAPSSPVDAAKDALDRLEIPPAAVTRISELMSVGASLIVTDEGLGPETGQETDFVVLTREHAAAERPSKKR